MAPSPIVDGVFLDGAAGPGGVGDRLRTIEHTARDLRDQLAAVIGSPGEGAAPIVVHEAHAELTQLLEDERASPLRRLLARPLSHLAPRSFDASGRPRDAAPIAALERRAENMFARASTALAVHEGVRALREHVSALRVRYQRIPHAVAAHLARAGLDEETLLRVRRTSEVALLERRAGAVDQELARLVALVPGRPIAPAARLGADDPTPEELIAALKLRRRERRSVSRRAAQALEVRPLSAAHLHAIDAAHRTLERTSERATEDAFSRSDADLVVQRLVEYALQPEAPLGRRHDDLPLWHDVLRVALASLDPLAERSTVPPHLGVAPAAARQAQPLTASVCFVIPIDDRFALVTNKSEIAREPSAETAEDADVPRRALSCVRVWDGRYEPGGVLECHAFPSDAMSAEESSLAALDLEPVFDGVSASRPGWYLTRRRAALRVLFEHEGEWFARIETKGELEPLPLPLWEPYQGDDHPVLVLHATVPLARREPVDVGIPASWPRRASSPKGSMGIDTRVVRTPFLPHPVAWLRAPSVPSAESVAALERERACFAALATRDWRLSPHPLASGRLVPDGVIGELYAAPLALPFAERFGPLVDWLTRDRARKIACLRAVARALVASHESGFALGACPLEAFAFAPEYSASAGGGEPRPRAAVVAAPYAMPIRPSPLAFAPPFSDDVPEWPRLGFRGFPPPLLADAKRATAETDAALFTLLALDLLATESVAPAGEQLRWDDVLDVVDKRATRFNHRDHARRLVAWLADPEKWQALLALVQRLAGDAPASEIDFMLP